MSSKILYSKSNTEFLSRELGFLTNSPDLSFQSNVINDINKGIVPVIEVGTNSDDLKFLSQLPTKSWVAIFSLDESCNFILNYRILKMKSVKCIIKQYPISGHLKFNIKFYLLSLSSLIFLSNQKRSIEWYKNLAKWIIIGINLSFRKILINLAEKFFKKKEVYIPLGYSDSFCQGYLAKYENIKNDRIQSLISHSDKMQITSVNKSHSIVFFGQKGNFIRNLLLESLKKIDGALVVQRDTFGAYPDESQEHVVNSLESISHTEKSWFTFCPPGNISSMTYRLSESLFLGSIPISVEINITDPCFMYNKKFQPFTVLSWTKIFDEALHLAREKRKEIYDRKWSDFKSLVEKSNELIDNVLKSNENF